MLQPRDVAATLDIGVTTLRRWSREFEPYLSAAAASSLTEAGGPTKRRYTDADVACLAAIKRAYDDRRSTQEILTLLASGALPPLEDVVVHNAAAPARDNKPPVSGSVAPVGGSGVNPQALLAQLQAISAALPALADSLAGGEQQRAEVTALVEQQRAALAALQAQHEAEASTRAEQLAAMLRAQQYLVEETRQERRALEQLRQEIAAERATPKVLAEAPSLGARVRRLFTRES